MTLDEYIVAMGIRLVDREEDLSCARAGDGVLDPFAARGPVGGACDIVSREVWTDSLLLHELLHEVLHVVLAVPMVPLAVQPNECEFLIPIERAYARALLDTRQYADAVDWQEVTGCEQDWFADQPLSVWDRISDPPFRLWQTDYTRSACWQRGLSLGRALGVLDANGKPTFRSPWWDALSPDDTAYLARRALEVKEALDRQKLEKDEETS